MTRASASSQAYSPDKLIAGDLPLLSMQITLVSGQNLKRGAVLGKITASGKYTLSASGATDGSETPDAILAEDTDASAGDVVTIAYFRGEFNENALTLGSGHTADSVREGLRQKGIWLVAADKVE
jgi:hypothetical protein